ncbi:MAG: hypothetical protein CVT84_02865 [Alphaproteobacteria bacterium HGW-Alphaproteobacteria-6]|nr:MAG: hypothetical protein CVT84_02865 [Alphaproteobacteria bacterium HGW-Alphaproteobacteria-6]
MTDTQMDQFLEEFYRLSILSYLKDEGVLDHGELELFDWYLKVGEHNIDEMLKGYIDEDSLVLVDYYIDRVRHSHVFHLTSLVEKSLRRATEWLELRHRVKFDPNKGGRWKWQKRLEFLKNGGFSDIDDGTWHTLDVLIQTRNILAHPNAPQRPELDSTTTKRHSELEKLAQKIGSTPGIKVDHGMVVIGSDFARHCLIAFTAFSKHVDCQIQQSFKSLNRNVH